VDTAGNLLRDFPADLFAILAFFDACNHAAPLDRDHLAPGMT